MPGLRDYLSQFFFDSHCGGAFLKNDIDSSMNSFSIINFRNRQHQKATYGHAEVWLGKFLENTVDTTLYPCQKNNIHSSESSNFSKQNEV